MRRSAITAGFHSVKIAPFDGIRQRYLREPEQRELLARGVACVAAVRDAVGPSVDVKVDCHGRFDVPTAVEMARELRALGVTWFEEPVPTTTWRRCSACGRLFSMREWNWSAASASTA
jgi:galactonate dehydratase